MSFIWVFNKKYLYFIRVFNKIKKYFIWVFNKKSDFLQKTYYITYILIILVDFYASSRFIAIRIRINVPEVDPDPAKW